MAGLGSTDSFPAYDEEFEFFQSWDYPDSDSEVSSQVLAVADISSLNKKQVQFIYDYYRRKFGEVNIPLGELLDQCDLYASHLPSFLHDLNETSDHTQRGVTDTSTSIGNSTSGESSAHGGITAPVESSSLQTDAVPVAGQEISVSEGVQASGGDSVDGNFSKTAAKFASKVGLGHKSTKSVKSSSVPSSTTFSASSSTKNPPTVDVPDAKLQRYLLRNELAALQKEHELLDANRKCIGCKTRMRDIAYLPCGHFLMCKVCAEPIYECQKCHKEILATAQTFLS